MPTGNPLFDAMAAKIDFAPMLPHLDRLPDAQTAMLFAFGALMLVQVVVQGCVFVMRALRGYDESETRYLSGRLALRKNHGSRYKGKATKDDEILASLFEKKLLRNDDAWYRARDKVHRWDDRTRI